MTVHPNRPLTNSSISPRSSPGPQLSDTQPPIRCTWKICAQWKEESTQRRLEICPTLKKLKYHLLSSVLMLSTHLQNGVKTNTQSTELFPVPLVFMQARKITIGFIVLRNMPTFPYGAGGSLHRHLLQPFQGNCHFYSLWGRQQYNRDGQRPTNETVG